MNQFNLTLPEIGLLPIIESNLTAIYNTALGEREAKNYAMSVFKAAHFINLRNNRAEDLLSPEVLTAMSIKANYFPMGTPRFVICIDGRVLTKLIACFHGNSYHVPAGDTKIDFLPIKDGYGELFLRDGLLSKIIDTTIFEQGFLHEVLDSHLYCAAGGLGANDRHCCEVQDAGLWDDLVRKKEMKKAIIKHCQQKHVGKAVFVTQMSFNPNNGYSFFGLEKDDCLAVAKDKGYTNEVISALVEQGLIISTKKLADDEFKEIFVQHYFDCDYQNDYSRSTKMFWENFQKMADEVLPILETEIKNILSLESETELKQTAALILASSYNGFLHNYQADGVQKDYPYANHKESVITVTISERGPFSGAESFFVHPESPSISEEIKLGRSLIIGNRHKKRMSALEIEAVNKVFSNYDDYTKTPVLAFFFQRTSRQLTEVELEKLQSIDFSDAIETDWFNMNNQEFLDSYLEQKWPGIPAAIAYTVNRLRQQAINIYAPNQSSTDDFLSGRILPIWAIAGPNRRIFNIVPFVMNGYTE